MQYRHVFHAGNFADVHKHVILLALLERLKRKPTPLFYLDTHAGRGRYDLRSSAAHRGGEWQAGIGKLWSLASQDPELARYLQAVRGTQRQPEHYPGSPLVAVNALRPGDRAVFVERLAEEAHALTKELRGRRGISVREDDGYAALNAYLPPKENRGLVLIDPPYEAEREFNAVADALQTSLGRWPNGMFALWYPIKATPEVARLHARLKSSGLRKLLLLELAVRPANAPLGLNGSGMLIANPPWQFDTELNRTQQELHQALAIDGAGGARVTWLVPE